MATLDQLLAFARAVDRRRRGNSRVVPGLRSGVGVFGGSGIRVGLEVHPAAVSGGGHFDAVAGDRASAAGGGRCPVQFDGRRSPGPGRQSPRRVRHALLRRGAVDVGGVSRPVEVDRRDPVVARGARGEARVTVACSGPPGIPYEIRPRVAIVRGHLDQVPGDIPAAVIEGGVPVQFDHRGAVGVRTEVARRIGDLGAPPRSSVVSYRPIGEADTRLPTRSLTAFVPVSL